MRILLLGDTHLGILRRSWQAPSGWSRADDHMAAFRLALRPAFRQQVDLVVHSGDLFDRSRPPPQAVADASALLVEAARRVPVLVLAGNHDRHGLRVHLGHGAPGLSIIDRPTRIAAAGLQVAMVPHARHAREWAAFAAQAVGSGVDVLVTHQGVAGARVPGHTFRVGAPQETVDGRHLPRGVPLVLSGHIHPRQVVRVGATPVIYAGSTERTSFSESTQSKGTAIIEPGAPVCWRYCDLPTRPMRWIEHDHDVAQVHPGDWVGVPPAALRHLAPAIATRGGIVALPPARRGPRRDRRQLSLFAPAMAG